jgi:hypothetical protein
MFLCACTYVCVRVHCFRAQYASTTTTTITTSAALARETNNAQDGCRASWETTGGGDRTAIRRRRARRARHQMQARAVGLARAARTGISRARARQNTVNARKDARKRFPATARSSEATANTLRDRLADRDEGDVEDDDEEDGAPAPAAAAARLVAEREMSRPRGRRVLVASSPSALGRHGRLAGG